MILLDTNVLIYASTDQSPFIEWARRTIAAGVSEDGSAVNAVSLAEICVGDAEPETVADRLRSWGITLLDVPVAAAGPCEGIPGVPGAATCGIRSRRALSTATRFLHRCSCSGHGLAARDSRRGTVPDLFPDGHPPDALKGSRRRRAGPGPPLPLCLGSLPPRLDLPQPGQQRVPTGAQLVHFSPPQGICRWNTGVSYSPR